jgi:hypothetical protein
LHALEREVSNPVGPELVLHVGDLAYADGESKKWDKFMNAITPIASRVIPPTHPTRPAMIMAPIPSRLLQAWYLRTVLCAGN